MKKINYLKAYILAILFITVISSCKDSALDVVPLDRLSDANVWTDAGTADLFLNDIYASLPDGNNWEDPFEDFSDNSMCGYGWAGSRTLERQSTYTPTIYPGGNTLTIYWDTNYGFIRKCNVYIHNVTASNLADDYKKKGIAEARLLRAYFYHILWMSYGGVPIITEALDRITQGDEIFHPRSTAEETAKFIINECAAAANDLPVNNIAPKATKGAALTLKGWVELYYASPLYNTENDKGRWAAAAATNKEVMDLGVYELYPDYGGLFLPEGNNSKEGIFYRQYFPRLNGSRASGKMATPYTKNAAHTGWGAINPTQDLVDDYAMDDGKIITDPTSDYDPQQPYLNRERRFYESIVYDGSYWYNDTIYTRLDVGSPNQLDLSDAGDNTNTGYNLRKRMNPNIPLGADNWDGATGNENYYYFRYAEVLLNYAEAQNEAVGPTDLSIYDAINKVRQRNPANPYLPPLAPGLNQDDMRTAIRRERRVELAFEDKRRWDIIRWKTAVSLYSKGLHAMKIEDINGTLKYTIINAPTGDRQFAPKNYWFPVPQVVIDQNPAIKAQNGGPDNWVNGQNPGY